MRKSLPEGSADENEEEEVGGFGGIKNQSVDEIIAKAKAIESYCSAPVSIGHTASIGQEASASLTASIGFKASVGLTDDLDNLAELGELDGDGMAIFLLS